MPTSEQTPKQKILLFLMQIAITLLIALNLPMTAYATSVN